MKNVYLDYAATTPIDPRVLAKMNRVYKMGLGNSMSLHSKGQKAMSLIEESRQVLAKMIGATAKEIYFTSSATESNNWAIKGVVWASAKQNKKRNHIIVSELEHDCVLGSARWLSKNGFEVDYLKYGQDIKKLIKKNTILVSVMQVNNETGEVVDVAKIGKLCRNRGVLFHTDASQSFGKIPIDVDKMKIDLLTASSHKIYGPKGVAMLYIRSGVAIEPLLNGGGQEFGLRSSTSNTPAIVGFGQAGKLMESEDKTKIKNLNKFLKRELLKIEGVSLNGKNTIDNIINFSVENIEGEALMLGLDGEGIEVSTGSACSSNSLQPSHVLMAMGLPVETAHGSIRVSLGRWTTKEELKYFLEKLKKEINRLRKISTEK